MRRFARRFFYEVGDIFDYFAEPHMKPRRRARRSPRLWAMFVWRGGLRLAWQNATQSHTPERFR